MSENSVNGRPQHETREPTGNIRAIQITIHDWKGVTVGKILRNNE